MQMQNILQNTCFSYYNSTFVILIYLFMLFFRCHYNIVSYIPYNIHETSPPSPAPLPILNPPPPLAIVCKEIVIINIFNAL